MHLFSFLKKGFTAIFLCCILLTECVFAREFIDFGSSLEIFTTKHGMETLAKLPDGRRIRQITPANKKNIVTLYPRDNDIWFPEFDRAEIDMPVYVPADSSVKSIRLRLQDVEGEILNLSAQVPASDKAEWRTLTFRINAADPGLKKKQITVVSRAYGKVFKTSKLTNNRLDFPVSLKRIDIVFSPQSGKTNMIGLGNTTIREQGVIAKLETGKNINVWDINEKKPLGLDFYNGTGTEQTLNVAWLVKGMDGKFVNSSNCEFRIASGKTHFIKLKVPEKQCVYDVTYTVIRNNNPESKHSYHKRFAAMTPSGPTPGLAKEFIFGICSSTVNRSHMPEQKKEIEAFSLCGAKLFRCGYSWAYIQPEKNKFNFEKNDYLVNLLAKNGVEQQKLFSWSPVWAIAKDWKPLRKKGLSRPDYDAWAKWVYTCVKHYKGKIRFFETWNEPDIAYFANFSPEEYTQLQRIAYRELKKANPDAMLIAGGFANSGGEKLQRYAFTHAPNTCDIHGYHGHCQFVQYPPTIKLLKKIRRECKVKQPWFANETAASSTDENVLSENLFKKTLFSWANGSMGYTWYNLRNNGFDPKNGEHNFGLFTHDFQPKCAYLTFNMLAGFYRNCHFVSKLDARSDCYAYRFEDEKAALLGMWNESMDCNNQFLFFETNAKKAEYIDLYGNVSKVELYKRGEGKSEKLLLADVSFRPGTYRLYPASATVKYLCPFVEAANRIYVKPGSQREIRFRVKNPFGKKQKVALKIATPANVSCEKPAITRTLAANQLETVSYLLKADDQFRSQQNETPTLTLTIGIPELHISVNIEYPLQPAVAISKKHKRNTSLYLNKSGQVTSLVTSEPSTAHLRWTGTGDLSAYTYLFYPQNELMHIQVAVIDDVHHQDRHGYEIFFGDSLQFLFLFPGQNNVWEIGESVSNDGKAESFIWAAPDGFSTKEVLKKIKVTYSRSDKNILFYNLYLPLKALGTSTKELKEKGFRFNLMVNDNDGTCRESYMSISKKPKIPEEFPVIELE